jgi:hypothetical protein
MSNNNIIQENTHYTLFPLTKYFYKIGTERWNEPFNPDENIGYCGPPDRCCVDCYICFIPLCFTIDITSLCLLQCFAQF